ncbi:hypothetical protein GLUCOINTEAF2_0200996 [Komagataeibacter intermedius AF2]|uniref:Uncharacterized protein n=1 Tax=Komagataeibacter intermedius AF2 TaxID=1458464 RepID=A0A0N1F9W6_9PROT|nr:hypothetical protein GLUCOINTEAF2_0200996 [Komagataeibacter intermedius AF2]
MLLRAQVDTVLSTRYAEYARTARQMLDEGWHDVTLT